MKARNYIFLQDEKRDVSAQAAMLITGFGRTVWCPWCIMNRNRFFLSLMTHISNIATNGLLILWHAPHFSIKPPVHTWEMRPSPWRAFCIASRTNSWRASVFNMVLWEKRQLLSGWSVIPERNCWNDHSRGGSSCHIPITRMRTGHVDIVPSTNPSPNSIPHRLMTAPHAWFLWPGAYQPCCGMGSCACL